MRVVLLALGFAACADPVFYQQRIYVSEPRLNMTRINGPGYQMDFPAEGIRLPESLMLADSGEVLAGGACPTESLVGIALYPGTIVASDIDVTNEMPTLDVVEQGPGVVSVEVNYEVPYECAGTTTRRLSGTSTFTLFPSSRIVRHDLVRATDTALLSNPGCGCAQGDTSPFIFTSYWMFNTSQLVNPSNVPITSGTPGPSVCAAIGEDLVALQWSPGMTRVERPMNAAAAVYDLVRGSIDTTERSVTSALQVGYQQTNCNDVHQGLASPPLTIDGREITMNPDGIYEDLDAHVGGEFQILANDGSLAPFAVLLNIGDFKHVRVSRSEGAYAVQPAANGGYLFWFDDGLSDNESIYITPY